MVALQAKAHESSFERLTAYRLKYPVVLPGLARLTVPSSTPGAAGLATACSLGVACAFGAAGSLSLSPHPTDASKDAQTNVKKACAAR